MTVKTKVYNKDENINQYTLSNSTGSLVVNVIDYGATITHIFVLDKNGQKRDVVLGWDDMDGYLGMRGPNPFFGAAIGRCANRITKGKFDLNGKTYQLAVNNGPNALHGGIKGFDKRKWSLIRQTDNSITLGLVSDDGEEGYPGSISVEVTYSVDDNNELRLEYSGKLCETQTQTQTSETIINLTNHSYFNLNGSTSDDELDVLNHTVLMTVSEHLEINNELQPTGKILSTKQDSPLMDFTDVHTIGERIAGVKPNGYDHCYVIEADEQKFNIGGNDSIRKAIVVVKSPATGITLTFSTTEPGFQFYSGNNLSELQKTKSSQSSDELALRKNAGFCLEAQRFPNAINEDKWKRQVILSPKQTYRQITSYKFGVE